MSFLGTETLHRGQRVRIKRNYKGSFQAAIGKIGEVLRGSDDEGVATVWIHDLEKGIDVRVEEAKPLDYIEHTPDTKPTSDKAILKFSMDIFDVLITCPDYTPEVKYEKSSTLSMEATTSKNDLPYVGQKIVCNGVKGKIVEVLSSDDIEEVHVKVNLYKRPRVINKKSKRTLSTAE